MCERKTLKKKQGNDFLLVLPVLQCARLHHFLKDKQYLNDLFSLYPVLERRINEIIQNAIDIYKEVIERIEKDADVLMKKFNITEKGFVVNHLSTDFSDSHKKGRRVFCVEFVSGDKILYKPRSLQK